MFYWHKEGFCNNVEGFVLDFEGHEVMLSCQIRIRLERNGHWVPRIQEPKMVVFDRMGWD